MSRRRSRNTANDMSKGHPIRSCVQCTREVSPAVSHKAERLGEGDLGSCNPPGQAKAAGSHKAKNKTGQLA